MYNHLESNSILCDVQHGFRENHSCETQLITTIHDKATHLNSGDQVDVLFLDSSKAFDNIMCLTHSYFTNWKTTESMGPT